MSHTPGPWINDASHPEWERNVIWANDVVVAHVVDDQHGNADANASLIAAAPELLAAMKAAVSEISGWGFSTTPDPGDTDFVLECKRIIAKAEGGE
jgi:hypothetical protein